VKIGSVVKLHVNQKYIILEKVGKGFQNVIDVSCGVKVIQIGIIKVNKKIVSIVRPNAKKV